MQRSVGHLLTHASTALLTPACIHPTCPPNRASLQVQLTLGASKLENKDTWGKSDPFVRISKARENGEWAPVLKTEVSGRGGGVGGGQARCASSPVAVCLPGCKAPLILAFCSSHMLAYLPTCCAGDQQQPQPVVAPVQPFHCAALQW